MDTGLLDTDRHLGINAAPSNRLLVRSTLTCSPFRIYDYVEIVTSDDQVFPIWEVYMGAVPAASNFIYSYPTDTRADVVGYQIT